MAGTNPARSSRSEISIGGAMRLPLRTAVRIVAVSTLVVLPACRDVGVYWGKDPQRSIHVGDDEEHEVKIYIVEPDDTDPQGSNRERLDATNEKTLYTSIGKMTAGWDAKKSTRFRSALAVCIKEAGTENEQSP